MSEGAVDSEAPLRRSLARHRMFATGLLLVMVALTFVAYAMPPSLPTLALRDGAKAGLIGGLADWFAVTALFRHPLGLPIPHTAILPAQKERLGTALGRFVANHVFTEADITRFLAGLDLPEIIGRFLADPATSRPAAEALAASMPGLLRALEDGRASRIIVRLLPRIASGPAANQLVARALQSLVESGHHQEVFSFILAHLRSALSSHQLELKQAIRERVREQGGMLVGWAVGANIASRVIAAINVELDRIGPDSSELREAFDEWVRREVLSLTENEARGAELGAALKRVIGHPSVRIWSAEIWARLRDSIIMDTKRHSGHSVTLLQNALANLGTLLAEDPASRRRISVAAGVVVARLLPAAQAEIAGFIARVVGNWDAETITEKLELRVGRDLQYIRVNGTLVGFLAGLVLFALLHFGFQQQG